MKTKSFLAALIVLISATAFANGPGLRVAVVGQQMPGIFKVIYESENLDNVTLTIYNDNGDNVFTQVTRNTRGFIQPISMKLMEPGEYTVEVSGENGTVEQKIVYEQAKSLKNVYVAKLPAEGKYLLTVPGNGTKEVNVSIFDGQKNLVHSEDRIIDGGLGLVFALQDVSGVPTFEVTEKSGHIHPIDH